MRLEAVCLLCATLSFPAAGAPITYTYSGNFSGSLGGVSFSNQAITITGVSDTNAVVSSFGNSLFTNQLPALYVNVTNIGSAAFLGYNDIFYTDLGPGLTINGATLNTGSDFFDSEYTLGQNYDLRSNLGPLPVTLISGGAGSANTTAGRLILSGQTSTITFAALVPEPSTMALLTFKIAAVLAHRGYRHRTNV